jgi:hypothetical protein
MSVRDLTAATESLAALVAGLDAGDLPASDGPHLVELGAKIERLGHAVRLAGTARVAAAGTWQGKGDRSAAEWLARTTGTSMSEAIGAVATAKQLDRLPATAAAVRRGELSPEQAKEVTAAAAADPTAEARLLQHAGQGSLGELRNECKRVRAAADLDPEATHRRIHQARHVRSRTDADGTWVMTVRGTTASGARILSGLRHRADGIFREARRAGRRDAEEAYLFDALEQVCADPGAGAVLPKGANAKVIVRIDWAALVRGRPIDGEVCEIAGVGPVPVSVVRELSEDAFVAAVITKGTDICSVTHLGRRHTALQVTAMQWRDPECTRLGCSNTVRLEYDHREDWAHTHVTRVDQSDRLCHHDHRLKTESGWMLERGTGKRRMLPPDHPDHPLQDELQVAIARARERFRGGVVPGSAQDGERGLGDGLVLGVVAAAHADAADDRAVDGDRVAAAEDHEPVDAVGGAEGQGAVVLDEVVPAVRRHPEADGGVRLVLRDLHGHEGGAVHPVERLEDAALVADGDGEALAERRAVLGGGGDEPAGQVQGDRGLGHHVVAHA